jgi:hypothetical protein
VEARLGGAPAPGSFAANQLRECAEHERHFESDAMDGLEMQPPPPQW